ncbi:MAG: ROK family transcriptional regulator [Pseudomonadota bacterium]|nr:ROK family transcriptional regulator [Pseudomonadota bacterium]
MKTADPELMRAINRYHVIDAIRRDGPIARVTIAERTELSRATVSAITGDLLETGLIRAVTVETNESGARGRPRVLLVIRGEACHVVGVKLAAHRIGVMVTDARGEPLGSTLMPIRLARQSPSVIADLVEDGVRQCVADAGLRMTDIKGVGVGLPGVIDAVAGVSHWSPVLGSAAVPFAHQIEQRLETPVLIENDANLVALAEHWFGVGRGRPTFMVVTIEDGIGMALVMDGRLHRGAHGIGPEFGHVKVDPLGLPCRCGGRGCLETYASGWGILQQALACSAAEAGPVGSALADITSRAAAGDKQLAELFRRAGALLGLAIANAINMLNAPLLVISGDGLRAGDMLRLPLLQAVAANSIPALREATEIIFHPWGDEMWARGAAAIALRQIYESALNG